jgi:hypothetical protein
MLHILLLISSSIELSPILTNYDATLYYSLLTGKAKHILSTNMRLEHMVLADITCIVVINVATLLLLLIGWKAASR